MMARRRASGKELLARGIRVGKERVQKHIQLHGTTARGKRRFEVTTDSRHDLPIGANLLNREFTVTEPNRVIVLAPRLSGLQAM